MNERGNINLTYKRQIEFAGAFFQKEQQELS